MKSRKFSKDNNQIQINPIIKDLIINKEEDVVEFKDGRQDSWGFQSTYDFFKENNQLKNESVGS